MGIIRNELEHIHQALNMVKSKHYNEMIPCICKECVNKSESYPFSYELLRRRMAKQGFKNYCGYSDEEVPIEQLLKGFEKPEAHKNLLRQIIITASHLQGLAKTIKPGENNRNDIMTSFLSARGVWVKDQSRWGLSASGKSMGQLDLKIENEEQQAVAVVEAFNLTYLDKDRINKHLKKIFKYDPGGLEQNFIIVYADARDFLDLWQKYLAYIPNIDFPYTLTDGPREEASDFTDIRIAQTTHQRQGKQTTLYHLFINMTPG